MKKSIIAVALSLFATIAFANGPGAPGGPGRGEPPQGDPGRGGEAEAIVGADGSAYVLQVTSSTSNGTTTITRELVAISPSGAVAWRVAAPAGRARLILSGNNLISVDTTAATATTAATSTLTALSTATGATAWTTTLDGVAHDLTPVNGGVYAIVVTPAASSSTSPARTLVAVSSSGAILWKAAL